MSERPNQMWERERERAPGVLALQDGTIFRGRAFGAYLGAERASVGELVFNTSMFGYQEILSDPSYAGQTITFTCPHIGNVGCNDEDDESPRVFATGVVIRDESPLASNFRARRSLDEHLRRAGVMGLAGVDTRAIVNHLRDHGAQMCAMAAGADVNPDDLVVRARAARSMLGSNHVDHVTCAAPYTWRESSWSLRTPDGGTGHRLIPDELLAGRPHVVALDCGVKRAILRLLVDAGFRVTVVPAHTAAAGILAHRPDALFISNGPGDPAALGHIVAGVRELAGRLPMFGICLGHQILAQVFGGSTYKLKFGHRGGNHPVRDHATGKVEITVQNHGFAVDAASLPSDVRVTHLNLNDRTVEGLDVPGCRASSVQYHPESSPGPHDAHYLFRRFFHAVTAGSQPTL